MSFKYGFYNSVNGDRRYDAVDFGRIFDGVINDGVFGTVGKGMIVQAGDGMVVVVGNGKAWFEHTWSWLTADLPVVISTANSVYPRIDAIVLEINPDTRVNEIKTVEGTPASTAVKPTLTEHQHVLAYVTVRAGATSILAGDIEVVVGTSQTPIVTGALQLLNLDPVIQSYTNKWGQDFHEWFTHLQNELDEHQAAHLQNQIDHLDGFHVGDLLVTKSTHLDDTWILANGQWVSAALYPDAAEAFDILKVGNIRMLGATLGVARPYVHIPRKIDGEIVLGGRNGNGEYASFIATKNFENVNQLLSSGNVFTHSYENTDQFLTYDSVRHKIVYMVPVDDTRNKGILYESDTLPVATVQTDWTKIGNVSFFVEENGRWCVDYVCYQGYYYALVWKSNSPFTPHVQIYRSASADMSNATKMYDAEIHYNQMPGREWFYEIDGRLVCIIYDTPSYESGTMNRLRIGYIANPLVEWTFNEIQNPTPSSGPGQYSYSGADGIFFEKIDGKYYFHMGRAVSMFDTSKLTVIDDIYNPTSWTIADDCTALYETNSYFIKISCRYINEDSLYVVYMDVQDKSVYPELDLTDSTKWTRISGEHEFILFGKVPIVPYYLAERPDNKTIVMAVQGYSNNDHATSFEACDSNVFQVPSVSVIVSGFSNYIKASY